MRAVPHPTLDILHGARQALDTAFQGYFAVRDVPHRRVAGFRNVVVFGNVVKQVLQDLPSESSDFEKWYKPIRKEFRTALVMKLFEQLLIEIRKKDELGVPSIARLRGFNYPDDMPKLGRKPASARELFMGDSAGGTGWEVEAFPGRVEKYYAILPTAYGTIDEFLSNTAVMQTSKDTRPIDPAKLCEQYVTSLEKVLRAAETHFKS